MKEHIGLALEDVRGTIRSCTADYADRFRCGGPFYVIRDEQVEQPIVVVVKPPGAGRPLPMSFCKSRLGRNIGKCTIAVVVEELTAVDSSYEEIDPSIIVIVRGGNAHAEIHALNAGLLSYIGKCAVAVVAVKPVPIPGIALVHFG